MNHKIAAAASTFGVAALAFSAAALAQTPSPGTTVTPGATGTASGTGTAVTTPVSTGTTVVTGTATVQGTSVVTGTPQVVPTIVVSPTLYQAGGTGDFPFAHPAFQRTWERTDSLVSSGQVSRTWFWGPGPNSLGLIEPYAQGAGGQHLVQYFDKSRMEVNNPTADQSQPFFVTNGLLTVELISGYIQRGDKEFVQYRPACIPMSGDFGDTNAPTYFAFQGVSNTQAGDHNAPDRTGQKVLETIDRNGKTGTDNSKNNVPGTELVYYEKQTQHNIAKVFWDFLNSSGPVKNANGQVVTEQLIQPWFFASGLPISEPYWAKAKINGELKDVMIQAYERRALTYVPTNQPGFQVEMANIGQHYFDWRYRNYGYCPQNPVTTPTPPVPAPSGTVVSGTPVATGTPAATGTVVGTGTPAATGTAVATGTVVSTSTPVATGTAVTGTPSATTTPR